MRSADCTAGLAGLAVAALAVCSALANASATAQTEPRPASPSQAAAPQTATPQPQAIAPPTPAPLGPAPQATTAASSPASASEIPRPFTATYAIEWRGMGAGTSTIELAKTAPDAFRYSSRNAARGMFRIALPDTITQTSEFSITDGKVVPHSFAADDGSSDTARDVNLKFDWNARQVTGTAEDKPVSAPLEDGVQDAGSVQIALMRELAAGRSPSSFMMIDKDAVKEYQYVREGEASIDTALGKLDTVVYTSQRTGSTRLTKLWIAPSLGYIPVRAEQLRKGKREFTMQIRTLKR
jgi:hypothetical protein